MIAGEEVRAAIDEIRQDLNVAQDRFHWFADQKLVKMQALHLKVMSIFAQQIDQFPNSIHPPHTSDR